MAVSACFVHISSSESALHCGWQMGIINLHLGFTTNTLATSVILSPDAQGLVVSFRMKLSQVAVICTPS